jgi:2-phospho-L-lactate guanylyltransferase
MTIAIVPVKRFEQGKSRLSPVLTTVPRERFVVSLFDHVMAVLARAPSIERILVVTDDARVAARALACGAEPLVDDVAGALGNAVRLGLSRREGAPAIVLMGDLPLLHESEVERLAARLSDCAVVLAPDSRDEGTNALAVASGISLPTFFGRGDSFPDHVRSATSAGLSLGIERSEGLAFDVDSPDDWRRLEAMRAPRVVGATR